MKGNFIYIREMRNRIERIDDYYLESKDVDP